MAVLGPANHTPCTFLHPRNEDNGGIRMRERSVTTSIGRRATLKVALLLALMLMGVPAANLEPVHGQTRSQTFPQTGKTVSAGFLDYWNGHGGLAQQGYPISNEMSEVSSIDGKTYTVQYFERAAFEYHPELAAPNNVLLSLLGAIQYNAHYSNGAP